VTPEPGSLTTVYQEVCKGHAAIADFRAKLLALLPIASAGGIALLLKGEHPLEDALVIAIGVFGLVVTFGLFMYELRGVQDCVELRARAEALEHAMHIPDGASQFAGRDRGHLGGLVDEIGAGWVVYPAVMAAWAYVATYGADIDGRIAGPILAVLYLAVVGAGVALFMHPERRERWRRARASPAESPARR
jgi:hypothetical protein